MMKRFQKLAPVLLAVLTVGLLFLVSLDFYGQQEYSLLQMILLSVINSIRAFAFDPSVSPEELMEGYGKAEAGFRIFLMYLYPVLLLLAQILVSWAVVKSLVILLKVGRKKHLFGKGRKDVLVFGLNPYVKELLEENEAWQIHLFCEEQLGDEEKLEL